MSAARRRGLENLGGIFTQLRRSEKWGRHLSIHAVFRVWEDAVGEALAKVARPVSLRGGTLRVEVSDPLGFSDSGGTVERDDRSPLSPGKMP